MTNTKAQIIHDIEFQVGWEGNSEDFPNWYSGLDGPVPVEERMSPGVERGGRPCLVWGTWENKPMQLI